MALPGIRPRRDYRLHDCARRPRRDVRWSNRAATRRSTIPRLRAVYNSNPLPALPPQYSREHRARGIHIRLTLMKLIASDPLFLRQSRDLPPQQPGPPIRGLISRRAEACHRHSRFSRAAARPAQLMAFSTTRCEGISKLGRVDVRRQVNVSRPGSPAAIGPDCGRRAPPARRRGVRRACAWPTGAIRRSRQIISASAMRRNKTASSCFSAGSSTWPGAESARRAGARKNLYRHAESGRRHSGRAPVCGGHSGHLRREEPDRHRMVFVSNRTGAKEIWTMNWDGTNQQAR